MSQDVIEVVSSDDDEPDTVQYESIKNGRIEVEGSLDCTRMPALNRSPTASNVPRWCLNNNTKTFGYLKRYRSKNTTPLMPTIINVQSLAKPSKQPQPLRISTSHAKVLPLKKKLLPAKRPSVFRKQVYTGPVSSVESIAESIEACIRRYSEPPVIDIDCSPPTTDVDMGPVENMSKSLQSASGRVDDNHCFEVVEKSSEGDRRDCNIPKAPESLEKSTVETISVRTNNCTDNEVTKTNGLDISANTLLFRKFLCRCGSLEEVVKDWQRACLKLRSYHEKANPHYIESRDFAQLLQSQLQKLTKEKLYYCVKEVLDDLKNHRAIRRMTLQSAPGSSTVSSAFQEKQPDPQTTVFGETLEFDHPLSVSDEKIVRRLTDTLEKLNRKIKKLEEAEVDLDDEEDSAYFQMQRYKERFSKVYCKLCEYTGDSLYAGRVTKKKIRFSGTSFPEANKMIERWLNKTESFPDFADVVKILKSLSLGLKPGLLRTLAAEAFREIGNHLQKRRRLELWDSLDTFAMEGDDPALSDPSLQAVLEENRKTYRRKEQEVIDKYVCKQMETKACDGDDTTRDVGEENDRGKEGEEEDDSDGEFGSNPDPEEDPLDSSVGIVSCSDTENENCDKKESKNNYKNCKSKWLRVESEKSSEDTRCSPRRETAPLPELELGEVTLENGIPTQGRCVPSQVPSEIIQNRKRSYCDSSDESRTQIFVEEECSVPEEVAFSRKKQMKLGSRGAQGADEREQHRRALPTAKPFGTVGKVVELNYVTLDFQQYSGLKSSTAETFKSSVLRDRMNLIHQNLKHQKEETPLKSVALGQKYTKNSKGLPRELKATIEDIKRHRSCEGIPQRFFSISSFDVRLPQTQSGLYRTHGTVANGGSPNDGFSGSNEKNDVPPSERQTERELPASNGTGGSSGSGNGDEDQEDDKNKPKNDKEIDGNEEETEDGDCEQDGDAVAQENSVDSPAVEQDGEYGNTEECKLNGSKNLECDANQEESAESGNKGVADTDDNSGDDRISEDCEVNGNDDSAFDANEESLSAESSEKRIVESEVNQNKNGQDGAGKMETTSIETEEREQEEEKTNDEAMGTDEGEEGTSNLRNEDQQNDKVPDAENEEEWNKDTDNEAESIEDERGNSLDVGNDFEDPLTAVPVVSPPPQLDGDTATSPLSNVDSCNADEGTDPKSSHKSDCGRGTTEMDDDNSENMNAASKTTNDEENSKSENSNTSSSDAPKSGDCGETKKDFEIPPPRTDLTLDMENFFTDQDPPENKKSRKPAWIDNGEESENESSDDNPSKDESAKSDEEASNKINEERCTEKASTTSEEGKEKNEEPNSSAKSQDTEVINRLPCPENEKSEKTAQKTLLGDRKRKNNIPISNELPKKVKRVATPVDKSSDIEVISETIVTKPPPVSADERVKRFLQSAGSSLQITVTRKKPMSRETQLALEQLRKLKNISATRVARTEPDVMVIDERQRSGPSRSPAVAQRSSGQARPSTQSPTVRNIAPGSMRNNTIRPPGRSPRPMPRGALSRSSRPLARLPVISSVQSCNSRTPVITGVRGNSTRFNALPGGRGTPQLTLRPSARPVTSARFPWGSSASSPAQSSRGRGQRGRGTTRGSPRAVPFVLLD